MTDMRRLTIEATKADGSYRVVWVGSSFENALEFLQKSTLKERLELWSKEHAESTKGFCPMAYRDADSKNVLIANTLKMLPDADTRQSGLIRNGSASF